MIYFLISFLTQYILFCLFYNRGLSGSKKVPFRKWYGCLGELRSLIPTAIRLVILTATATKATKGEILNTLYLSGEDIKFIEQSPDRPNI